jgi:uncharacterized protein YecT (DUF1311 family)
MAGDGSIDHRNTQCGKLVQIVLAGRVLMVKEAFFRVNRFFSLLFGLALLASPSSVDAQSWCRNASRPDEKLICKDARLGRLDDELNMVFHRRDREMSGPAKERLANEELRWLVSRHRCGANYACIERSYLGRIEALKGSAGEEFSAERESAGSSRTQEPRDQVGSSRTIPPRAGTSSEWVNPAPAR